MVIGGSNYGPAVASTANAKTFYQTGVCGMLEVRTLSLSSGGVKIIWNVIG